MSNGKRLLSTAAFLSFTVLGGLQQLSAQTAQTITFDSIPNRIFATSPFGIAAHSSSGLPVSLLATPPAVCRNAGGLITLLSAGACSITASQSGNVNFSAATSVIRSFTVTAAKASGTLLPAAGSPFGIGSGSQAVAVGDFNGDGFPDLATANAGDNTVTVLLGNGSGGFTAAAGSPFTVGASPYSIVVGDFNEDGVPDIATANGGDNTVSVLLGNSTNFSGAFGFAAAAGSPFAVGAVPVSIAIADFNGDGVQDLAVSNFTDSTVTVLLGNGSGGFTVATNSPFPVGTSPASVTVGDFNGDGIADLATANFGSNNVTVLLGNGTGGFGAPTAFGAGAGTFAVTVGDFNGDGKSDLAAANYTDNTVTVLLGDGTGGFTASATSPFAVGSEPYSLAVGDLDGDGNQDLAIANSSDSTVTVLLGNGAGGFTAAVAPVGGAYTVGANPGSVVVADLNGDGLLDLVTANGGDSTATVLLGGQAATTSVLSTTSPLTIDIGQSVPLTLTLSPTAPAFDAPTGTVTFSDGATVLGTATQTSSPFTFTTASLALGSHTLTAAYGGDARSLPSTSNTITIQVDTAQTITFAPLGNVTFGVSPFTISATASSGLTVSFASATPAVCTVSVNTVTIVTGGLCSTTASQSGNSSYTPAAPVTQSFNVTGASQTITFDAIPNQIFGVSPFAIEARSSSGLPITFTPTTPLPLVCKTASGLVTLLSAGTCSITVSQAGNVNFTAATPVTQSFTVNAAKPSSGLNAAVGSPLTAGASPQSVAVGDFNGDGFPDFAVANGTGGTVTVWLGNGSGGFTAATGSPFAVGASPYSVVVGDFNGDGIPDLATANGGSNTVTVLLGNSTNFSGAFGFTAATGSPFLVGNEPASLAVGDFNGDGIPDLAVANFSDSTITVLLGSNGGGFTAAANSPFTVGTKPGSVAVGDFNGDGFQDLATSNFGSNNVTVLLGNGSGGFTAAPNSPFTAGTGTLSIVVGDFNGDGFQDLAATNYTSNNVTVLLGSGLGGFTAAANSPFTVGTNPYSIVGGDVNGDGFQDLAIANFTDSTVTLLLGTGSGGFAAAPGSPFTVGTNPESIATADFNGDSIPDLVTANSGSNNATVLLGIGTAAQTITFGPLSGVTIGVAPFTISATVTSSLTVSFTSTTAAVCTVAGTTVTILAVGTCSITATQAGNSTYAAATPVTQSFTVANVVVAPPPFIPPPPALSLTILGTPGETAVGASVTVNFSASGGVQPYTWSANNLPAGVTQSSKTGALTGTPLQPGNYNVIVDVTDSETPQVTANLTVSLKVPGITTTSPLTPATAGRTYSQKFAAAGGTGTYSFSSTNAPAGLAFSGAILSGTPTVAGTVTFQVQVADGSGTTASSSFTLVVGPALSITSSGNLGEIAFGANLAGTLVAAGGNAPYTWSASNLPAGVTLNASSGALSGRPAQAANYGFNIQVSDSGTPAETASVTATLQVLGLTGPGPNTSSALPAGSTTAAYSQTFSAAGGTGPYAFSSANAPVGLSFSGAALSGTPSSVGSFSFTVSVADANGFTTSSVFSLIVTGPATPLKISGGGLTGGIIGTPYSQALTGTGGAPPYSWTIIGGTLPPGLAINGSGGVISGTPSTVGTYTFTAQATDSSGNSSSGVFTIAIAPQPLSLSGLVFPNGIAGTDFPLQILAGSGGVGPYTYTVSSGSLPPGLSLVNGAIGGVPTASGTFAFSITMNDAETPVLTTTSPTQIVIASQASANLLLSAGAITFNLVAGAAAAPVAQSVTVESSAVSQALNYSVVTTPAVSWLDVTGGGTAPGSITVALDPGALNLGVTSTPLTTGIVVTCLAPAACAGMSQTVVVSLSVTAPAPLLTFGTNPVDFSTTAFVTAPLSQQVTIQNSGGGAASLSAVTAADSWLTVSGVPGSVQAGAPAALTFTANPAGLGPGFFRTTVTLQSSAGTIGVPATLEITQTPNLTLSSGGAQFQSTLGNAPLDTTGAFQVGVAGNTSVNWTASVQAGASWLQLNEYTTSGTASSSSPGTVSYHLETAGLTAAQTYYGAIQVVASNAANSPLNFIVVLNVAQSTALPVPVIEPAGRLFQASLGGSAPPSQTVTVYSSSGSGVAYAASMNTTDGNAWLIVSPISGTSSTSSSAVVSTLSVNPGTLPAGIYTGTVSYQFSAAAIRTVNVTMVVTPGGSAGCSPTQLAATQTGLENNFAQPAGWPAPLSLNVVNNCGAPVGNAQVVATFSNGDPALSLNLVDATMGLYSGTWTPRTASGQVTVSAAATVPGVNSVVNSVSGQVVAGSVPLLTPGGTLHIYDPLPGGALGQGTVLQIYGSNFSASSAQATALPLPTTLGGTSVTIGGIAAPLYYVGPNQIDAQLPHELTPGNSYQVMVNSNGVLSMPDTIHVTTATPGIAAFASGQIVAQHADYSLVTESSPAVPGEYLVIYLSGLGLTDNILADGAQTPPSPALTPLIAPTLTLNGVSIPIYFSGLTPGYAGLYQMNFQIPLNTPNGDIQLVVSQGGSASNRAILPVHN